MFDAATPQNRLILAKYEDIAAQHTARVNEIGEDFAQRLAQYDAEAAERDRIAAERLPDIDRAHEAAKAEAVKAQQEAAAKPTWEREERNTVLSFGSPDDAAPQAAPRPQPPLPPVGEPEPEPVSPPAPNRVLAFGVDDEDPAPPPHPAARKPAHRADEDDDWSGQNWLR